jgi:hypothetical protein
VAGFRVTAPAKWIWMPPGKAHPRPRLSRALIHSEEARQRLLTSLKGDPHAAVAASPVR